MRLIDADSAKLSVSDYKIFRCQLGGLMDVAEFIDDQPTIDAVPVVRCRECKHRKYDDIFGTLWCNRDSCTKRVKQDDFCSYGEKRRDKDGTT